MKSVGVVNQHSPPSSKVYTPSLVELALREHLGFLSFPLDSLGGRYNLNPSRTSRFIGATVSDGPKYDSG